MGKSKKSCKTSETGVSIHAGTRLVTEEWKGSEIKWWSERQQRLFGDCFTSQTTYERPARDYLEICDDGIIQLQSFWSSLKPLKIDQAFTTKYGGIADLLSVHVDKDMLRAVFEFWDPSYRCFSSKEWDLTPTLEEYATLLKMQLFKPFSDQPPKLFMKVRDPPRPENYLAKLLHLDENEVTRLVTRNGTRRCISKEILFRFIQRNIAEEPGRRVFALAIYGLVIFPTVQGHIDLDIVYFFDRVHFGGIHATYSILAETFRSLSHCRKNPKSTFYACSQLLTLWLQGHLCSPPIVQGPEKRTKQEWMVDLYQLPARDVCWISSQLPQDCKLIVRCQKLDYVPLLGVWGEIGYSPVLVMRQFGIQQCVPYTFPLKDEGFDYVGIDFYGNIEKIKDAWSEITVCSRGIGILQITKSYQEWFDRKLRDMAPPADWMLDPVNKIVPTSNKALQARHMAEIEKGRRKEVELQSKVDQMMFEAQLHASVAKSTMESKENAVKELKRVKQLNRQLAEEFGPKALYNQKLVKRVKERQATLEAEIRSSIHTNQTLKVQIDTISREKRKLSIELEKSKRKCQKLSDDLEQKEKELQKNQIPTSWAIVPYQKPFV